MTAVRVLGLALISLNCAAETAAEFRSQAAALKARGDAAGALAFEEKALALTPDSASLHDEAGFLLAVLGRYQEAMEHFGKAIELAPSLASAHFHRGAAQWVLGAREEAVT